MIKFTRLICLILLLLPFQAFSKVSFPEEMEYDGISFKLCSQTKIKAMAIFTVGYGALYLENCEKSDQPLSGNKIFTINYSMEFTSEEFQKSSLELLKRNLPPSDFEKTKVSAEGFNAKYLPVKPGDKYYVAVTDNKGLSLKLNDAPVVSSKDPELIKHYFSIWFGSKPFSKSMKKKLLSPVTL